ncbi:hypothetical protein ScPMuIL_016592 [Solemya velum]
MFTVVLFCNSQLWCKVKGVETEGEFNFCHHEKHNKPISMSESQQFDQLFQELSDVLTECTGQEAEIGDAMAWFKKVLSFNVPHGKKNRGKSVVASYKALVSNPSEEDLKLAGIIGWCVELLQAFFLVTDDIMDGSLTRRGQPCWYKMDGVGLLAINDAIFLEMSMYRIFRQYLKDKPYYVNIMELFHEATNQTLVGQCLDMITAPPQGSVDFSQFNMERYSAIVKWKTAFYSFYLPIASAMYMNGITDETSHSTARRILLKMGHFFQVQDDYLDCYGDPEVIGKIGTDIEDNKCSWLVVQALSRVNDDQREVLKNCYGCQDSGKVKRVKDLYRELNLSDEYRKFEERSYKEIMDIIESCESLPKDMFIHYVNSVYKRNK